MLGSYRKSYFFDNITTEHQFDHLMIKLNRTARYPLKSTQTDFVRRLL